MMTSRFRVPDSLARWWTDKTPRERSLLAVLSIAVVGAAIWTLVWRPLTRDAASLREERTREAAALADARRMTDEIAGLAKAPQPPAPADVAAALERVLAQHGLRSAATELGWQDGRARIGFASAPYETLIAALETLQRQAQLRVVDAMLTARVEAQTVRAEVTLAR